MVELRGKVSTLQHDLDTSETVQRDFVRLSQSLQVQLEKIRQSEKEVSVMGLFFSFLCERGANFLSKVEDMKVICRFVRRK